MLIPCDYCGKEFYINPYRYNKSKTHCCSTECAGKLKATRKVIPCDNCGKEYSITEYNYNKNKSHCCSVKCMGEYMTKMGTETRRCEWCGEEFITQKASTKRFCGVKCQNEWQKTNTSEKHHSFSRKLIKCEWCGKEFYQKQYKINLDKHHFCCMPCNRAYYANVISQQEDFKEKARIRAVEMISNGCFSHTKTKPQEIVNNILENLNIKYVNEENFKYYAVDNYLPDNNLIIEVMGDFWHANPMKFNPVKNKKQIDRIPKDKRKHTYIKNNHNIEILYVWEKDLYEDKEKCLKLILEYINNDGILENYHSFNYCLDCNKNIKLNNEIIIPYQDMSQEELKQYIDN